MTSQRNQAKEEQPVFSWIRSSELLHMLFLLLSMSSSYLMIPGGFQISVQISLLPRRLQDWPLTPFCVSVQCSHCVLLLHDVCDAVKTMHHSALKPFIDVIYFFQSVMGSLQGGTLLSNCVF